MSQRTLSKQSSMSGDGFSSSGGSSSTFDSVSSSLMNRRLRSAEEGIFGVLLILIEHGKNGRIIPYVSILFDFLSTLGFCFASSFPWGRSTVSSISSALQSVQFRADSYISGYNQFLVLFWIAVSIVALSISCVYFCARMFYKGKITHILPIRFLRLFVGMLLSVFFVPMLNVLMVPLACTYSTGTLDAFTHLDCWSVTNGIHSVIAIISICVLGIFAIVVATVFFDPCPNSRPVEPLCAPHSYMDITFLISRAGLDNAPMTGRFLRSYTVLSSIFIILLNFATFAALLFWVPHFSLLTNRLKSISYTLILWASILLVIVAQRDDPSTDTLTFVFVGGLIPFGALGYCLPSLRLGSVDGRNLLQSVSRGSSTFVANNSSSSSPLNSVHANASASISGVLPMNAALRKVRFHSDIECELATRFLQQIDSPTDADLLLVRQIFLQGLRTFPNSIFLLLTFASFLQHVMNDRETALSLTERAAAMKPLFVFRFLISRQRKEMAKRDEDGGLDIVSSVDFTKNYSAARRFHRLCVSSMQELWRTLLPAKVNMKLIPTLLDYILRSEARAALHFDYLMRKYRSPRTLRAYSAFQSDVKNDFQFARALLESADEMESHHGKRGGNKDEGANQLPFSELDLELYGQIEGQKGSGILESGGETPGTIATMNRGNSVKPPFGRRESKAAVLSSSAAAAAAAAHRSQTPPSPEHNTPDQQAPPPCYSLYVTHQGDIITVQSPLLSSFLGFSGDENVSSGQHFPSLFFSQQSQELFADALLSASQPLISKRSSSRIINDEQEQQQPLHPLLQSAEDVLTDSDSDATDDGQDDDDEDKQDPEEDTDELVLDEEFKFVKRFAASGESETMKKLKFPVIRGFLLGKNLDSHYRRSMNPPAKSAVSLAVEKLVSDQPWQPFYYVLFLSQFGQIKLYLFPADTKPSGSVLLDHNQAISFADSQFCAALQIDRDGLIGASGDVFLPQTVVAVPESEPPSPSNAGGSSVAASVAASEGGGGVQHIHQAVDNESAARIGRYFVSFVVNDLSLTCMMDAANAGPDMIAVSMTTLLKPSISQGQALSQSSNHDKDGKSDAKRTASQRSGSLRSRNRTLSRRGRRSSIGASVLLGEQNKKSTTDILHRNVILAIATTMFFIIASYITSQLLAQRTSQVIDAMDAAGTVSQYGVRLASRARTIQLDFQRSDVTALRTDLKALYVRINVFGTTFAKVYALGEQEQDTALHDLYYKDSISVEELDGAENVTSNMYSLFALGRMYNLNANELASTCANIINGTTTFNASLAQLSVRSALYFITESGPYEVKDAMFKLAELYGAFAGRFMTQWKGIQTAAQALAILVLAGLVYVVNSSLRLTHLDRVDAIICLLRIPKDVIPEILERSYQIIQEEEELEAAGDIQELPDPEETSKLSKRNSRSSKKLASDDGKHNSVSIADVPSSPLAAAKATAGNHSMSDVHQDLRLEVASSENSDDPKAAPSFFGRFMSLWKKDASRTRKRKSYQGQLTHENIDKNLSSQLRSLQVRSYVVRYLFVVFIVAALLVVALSLGLRTVIRTENITNEIVVSHYRSLQIIFLRNLAQEVITRPIAQRPIYRQQIQDAYIAASAAHSDLLYGNPARGLVGNAFRYQPLEDWMYTEPKCHRKIASNCVGPSDPYYTRLYSSLGALVSFYILQIKKIAELPDSSLSSTQEFYKFIWNYSYDHVMDGVEYAATLTVQEAQGILEESISDQLTISLVALAIMALLYLFVFRPMVSLVRYEAKRTASILLMVPEKVADSIESIRIYIQNKTTELNL